MKILPTLVGLITVFYFAACSDNGSSVEAFNAAKVCPESARGTFVDERDGQEYRYTTIGSQVWMAQNLNYAVTDKTLLYPLTGEQADVRFACLYPDDNCMEKGLVYKWLTAYYACPEGWHLPRFDEWQKMIDVLGGDEEGGFRLKASSGWAVLNPGDDANWNDECGFSALPSIAGELYDGLYANWWLSDYEPDDSEPIKVWVLNFDGYGNFYRFKYNPPDDDAFFSVRCIKN